MASEKTTPLAPRKQPVISTSLLDEPTQRLYALSLGLLIQAIKFFDAFTDWFTLDPSRHLLRKWMVIDASYFIMLPIFRIPRLHFGPAAIVIQLILFLGLDVILFSGLSISHLSRAVIRTNQREISTAERIVNVPDIIESHGHLKGEHTILLSAIGTAKLNPDSGSFCLSLPENRVYIPVLFNNSQPSTIRYSLTPFNGVGGRVETTILNRRNIESNDKNRLALLNSDAEDDLYEDEHGAGSLIKSTQSPRSRDSESLSYIVITKPGILRLEESSDISSKEIRIRPHEVTIAPCPTAEFANEGLQGSYRCKGDSEDAVISLNGYAPLSLRWTKEISGRKEVSMVEGIAEDTQKSSKSTPIMQGLKVPLSFAFNVDGQHAYTLDEVTDGVGNTVFLNEPKRRKAAKAQSKVSRYLKVLRRSSWSFQHCEAGKPLVAGKEAQLSLGTVHYDKEDAPWKLTVRFRPAAEDGDSEQGGWERKVTVPNDSNRMSLTTTGPGEYTLLDVEGGFCTGDILNPDTCNTFEQPRPSADIAWESLHECSGDTGVSATLALKGQPPFKVTYTVSHDNGNPRRHVQSFPNSRGTLSLQPEKSGRYTYKFVELADANYDHVPLDGPTIDSVVHAPATAEFIESNQPNKPKSLYSCSGDVIDVDVALKGTLPWSLDLQINTAKGLETMSIRNLTHHRERLRIPVPKSLSKKGGSFDINLASIEDASGCKRSLVVPGVSVNVRRIKPTARFYGTSKVKESTVLEKETASLPLRLTGDGPWTIRYRTTHKPDDVRLKTLRSANDEIDVSDSGTYELVSVHDKYCPGDIVQPDSTFRVHWIPRPTAQLIEREDMSLQSHNNSHILKPICEGMSDSVDLKLTGRSPFQIMYNIARSGDRGQGLQLVDQPIFNSIQPRTRFQLSTMKAGRYFYEVKQIGDTVYPLLKHADFVLPREHRLLFEQEVVSRPSASFKSDGRPQYCLHDALIPQDTSPNGLIVLEGTPPFTLELNVKFFGGSETVTQVIEIAQNEWQLNLPGHHFRAVGPHIVTIVSVKDASGCSPVVEDSLQTIFVDVVESAAIIPYDRRSDYCVGDVLRFQLEGNAPWTVDYRFNKKLVHAKSKTSQFSRVPTAPGIFAIESIAHEQKKCRTTVEDLQYVIHDIPSAELAHGKVIYESIREEDQAEIVFTLFGEPPFTFTYQRAEADKNGQPGKVLETHTVSGLMTKQYSIFSSQEGTYTVTSISDRWCRYPPAQTDSTVEGA